MAVNLKMLINVAPFPEEQKKALIENIEKMSEDQKYRLSNAAWFALAQMFYGRLNAGRQKIMNEVVLGERQANANDYQELEAKLIHEFAQKLEMVESEESISEVRKQLEKFTRTNFSKKT